MVAEHTGAQLAALEVKMKEIEDRQRKDEDKIKNLEDKNMRDAEKFRKLEEALETMEQIKDDFGDKLAKRLTEIETTAHFIQGTFFADLKVVVEGPSPPIPGCEELFPHVYGGKLPYKLAERVIEVERKVTVNWDIHF